MLNTDEDGKLALREKLNLLAKLCLDNGIEIPDTVKTPKPAKKLCDLPVELLTAIFLEYAPFVLVPLPIDRHTVPLRNPVADIFSLERHARSIVKLICRFGRNRQMRRIAMEETFAGVTFNMLVTHADLSLPHPGNLLLGQWHPEGLRNVLRLAYQWTPDFIQDLLMRNIEKCHLRLNVGRGGVVARLHVSGLISELDQVTSALPALKSLRLSIDPADVREDTRRTAAIKLFREAKRMGIEDSQVWMGDFSSIPNTVEETKDKTEAEILESLKGGKAWLKI